MLFSFIATAEAYTTDMATTPFGEAIVTPLPAENVTVPAPIRATVNAAPTSILESAGSVTTDAEEDVSANNFSDRAAVSVKFPEIASIKTFA